MKTIWALAVLSAVLTLAGTAQADMIVTTASAAPSDQLLTFNSVGYTNFAWGFQWTADSGSSHTDVAQSFLVTGTNDWLVDAITVRVREFGTSVANQDYHLEIWTVGNASDFSGDSLVSAQSGTFPVSGLTTGYWTFDLDDVLLDSGQHYAFVLGFDSGSDSQRYVNLVNAYSATDLYLDGRMFLQTGTPQNWTTAGNSSNRDFDFYIQGTPVPEPASITLLSIGLVGLAVRRFRKN